MPEANGRFRVEEKTGGVENMNETRVFEDNTKTCKCGYKYNDPDGFRTMCPKCYAISKKNEEAISPASSMASSDKQQLENIFAECYNFVVKNVTLESEISDYWKGDGGRRAVATMINTLFMARTKVR